MTSNFFGGLSEEQRCLLSSGGWPALTGYLIPRPSRKSAGELVSRGLVVEHEALRSDAYGEYTVTEYIVPASVHRQWLAHLELERRHGDAA